MSAPPSQRVLSIGECMVEMAPTAEGLFSLGFAGDTLNTAWYLRRRLSPDWTVAYCSAVGTDAISRRMLGFLAGAGIDTAHVHRDPQRTLGLYLIELEAGERSFAYWRAQSAARRLAADPGRLRAALTGVRLAYVSGITLAILEGEGRRTLIEELARARGEGATVAFDPNLRPRLWEGGAEMRAWITRAAAIADVVLPSFDDEAGAFGDGQPTDTAARYLAAGAGLVVVKNGAGPITVSGEGESFAWTPPPAPAVVDTTAAGDSFNAGCLAARLEGQPLREAVAAGAALAGRVIGARGALVAGA